MEKNTEDYCDICGEYFSKRLLEILEAYDDIPCGCEQARAILFFENKVKRLERKLKEYETS